MLLLPLVFDSSGDEYMLIVVGCRLNSSGDDLCFLCRHSFGSAGCLGSIISCCLAIKCFYSMNFFGSDLKIENMLHLSSKVEKSHPVQFR